MKGWDIVFAMGGLLLGSKEVKQNGKSIYGDFW